MYVPVQYLQRLPAQGRYYEGIIRILFPHLDSFHYEVPTTTVDPTNVTPTTTPASSSP